MIDADVADDAGAASPSASDFKQQLAQTVPHLRAFARGLCGRADFADDLVQETLLKAWAARDRYREGAGIRPWTFVILRNTYLSEMRRNRFKGDYDEVVAERTMSAPAGQQDPLHLDDLRRALRLLSNEQREAILLVGAGGFSYEQAAGICNCAIGTMKSRVARARVAITQMIAENRVPQRSSGDDSAQEAHARILHEVDRIAGIAK